MTAADNIAFKAEGVREYLTLASQYLAEANALISDDRSPELNFLRFDLRDLLMGAQLASQRAARLAPPVSGPDDDTQEIQVPS